MKKYVASPGAEVIGVAMHNFFVSINKHQFEEIVQVKLSNAGIDRIDDDAWYSHQLVLDIFKQIQSDTLSQNLVALGMGYVETALFPPEVDNIQSGLILLADTYHLNIRNAPAEEGYQAEVISDKHIRIADKNPFPHDTVYGFIWGICKRFAKPNEVFEVHREYEVEDAPDNGGATYDIILE